jgi:hypothetical protein
VWGAAYGPICPGDCRHDLQGGVIDPTDPACRTERRLVYTSPDGYYMGLVEGQSSLPSEPAMAPSTAADPNQLSPAEQQDINDLTAIGIQPVSTVKKLAETGPTICENLTDAYRQNRSPMAWSRAAARKASCCARRSSSGIRLGTHRQGCRCRGVSGGDRSTAGSPPSRPRPPCFAPS